jgi:hypothetical protein
MVGCLDRHHRRKDAYQQEHRLEKTKALLEKNEGLVRKNDGLPRSNRSIAQAKANLE